MTIRLQTVADPQGLRSLTCRLQRLRPDSRRRWGTLTPHEMLCHLGDAAAMVLRVRPRSTVIPSRRRLLVKGIGLWAPLPWPHGWRTNPAHDPKAGGTRPSEFASDLARAIAGLDGIAVAAPGSLEPTHGLFGSMSVADWQRWAYRHTDHHLRPSLEDLFGGIGDPEDRKRRIHEAHHAWLPADRNRRLSQPASEHAGDHIAPGASPPVGTA